MYYNLYQNLQNLKLKQVTDTVTLQFDFDFDRKFGKENLTRQKEFDEKFRFQIN